MATVSLQPQNQDNIPDETRLWPMCWFVLIIFAICLLASVILSIAALIITKNLVTLAIPGPLLPAMRPMIRYLFPQGDKKGVLIRA